MFKLPKGINPEAKLSELQFAALDTETTGIDQTSRVVEIAIIQCDSTGSIQEEWSSLVNPSTPIPKGASNIHKITNAVVKNSPKYGELYDEILGRMKGRIPVVYNLTYDWRIMKNEADRLSKPWFSFFGICPLTLARKLFPAVPGGHSQANLSRYLNLHDDDEQDHRALADTRHTVKVLFEAVLPQLNDMTIQQLWDEQVAFAHLHEDKIRVRKRGRPVDLPWHDLAKETS